jgi:hypothetical protein
MTLVFNSQDANSVAVVAQAKAMRNAAFLALIKSAALKVKQLLVAPSDYVRASALSAAH